MCGGKEGEKGGEGLVWFCWLLSRTRLASLALAPVMRATSGGKSKQTTDGRVRARGPSPRACALRNLLVTDKEEAEGSRGRAQKCLINKHGHACVEIRRGGAKDWAWILGGIVVREYRACARFCCPRSVCSCVG